MPNKFDRVSIGRRDTPEGEVVVFIRGTEVLTEIPTKVVRGAVEFITKFGGGNKATSVDFCDFDLPRKHKISISAWWKRKIKVSLYNLKCADPLGTWDLIEVDPF